MESISTRTTVRNVPSTSRLELIARSVTTCAMISLCEFTVYTWVLTMTYLSLDVVVHIGFTV